MAAISARAYDQLLSQLDQLLNNSGRSTIKSRASLRKKELQSLREQLESLHNEYLEHKKQTKHAYAKFEIKFNAVHELVLAETKSHEKPGGVKGYIPL